MFFLFSPITLPHLIWKGGGGRQWRPKVKSSFAFLFYLLWRSFFFPAKLTILLSFISLLSIDFLNIYIYTLIRAKIPLCFPVSLLRSFVFRCSSHQLPFMSMYSEYNWFSTFLEILKYMGLSANTLKVIKPSPSRNVLHFSQF